MALAKGVGTQKRALRCGEDEFLKMFTRLSEITARFVLFSFFLFGFIFQIAGFVLQLITSYPLIASIPRLLPLTISLRLNFSDYAMMIRFTNSRVTAK